MNTKKKRPGTFIAISDSIWADSRFRRLPDSAQIRFVFLIGWSKNQRKDGWVDELALEQCGGKRDDLDVLLQHGLIEKAEDGGYLIVGYSDWQTTNSEIDAGQAAISEKRREAGVKSGESRRRKAEGKLTDPSTDDSWQRSVYASLATPPDSYNWAKTELDKVPAEHREAVAGYLAGKKGQLVSLLAKIDHGRKLTPPDPLTPVREVPKTDFSREQDDLLAPFLRDPEEQQHGTSDATAGSGGGEAR